MPTPPEVNTELLRARERFFDLGRVPEDAPLRPEVALSWKRSLASGVPPDRFDPDYAPELANERLREAATPILTRVGERLADTRTCLILADQQARILERHSTDRALSTGLDRARAAPGFALAETTVGTNGLGTVVAQGEPFVVSGAEHFNEAFHSFTCIGVPIHNPITGTVWGVLDITCGREYTEELLVPLAWEAARAVEEGLYHQSSRREQQLLRHFLASSRRRSRPIVVLGEQIMMAAPGAAGLVDGADQQLWERLREAGEGWQEVELADARVVTARCQPIREGHAVIGTVVELDTTRGVRPSVRAAVPALSGLVGRSAAWRSMCAQAHRRMSAQVPVLVTGEPGAGKLAVLAALLTAGGQAPYGVLDAALLPLLGERAWLERLRDALRPPATALVLRHVELVGERVGRALLAVLDDQSPTVRLSGTLTTGPGAETPYRPLVNRFGVARIDVPALRNRLDDVPALLADLTRRHAPETPPTWRPDAVAALSRLPWRGNLRELDQVVRQVLADRTSGDIAEASLPDAVRRQAFRRRLTPIEQLEMDAIRAALAQTGGNKLAAADAIGISRATLYRKMRAYGINAS